MGSRRAIISTSDLRRMAKVVKEQGVVIRGHVDPLGNLDFSLVPHVERASEDAGDLDNRLEEWGRT